jgi:hypothetical protein
VRVSLEGCAFESSAHTPVLLSGVRLRRKRVVSSSGARCAVSTRPSQRSARPSRSMPSAQFGGGCNGTLAFWAARAAFCDASISCRLRSKTPLRFSSVCLRLRRALRRADARYSSSVTAGGAALFARFD